MFCIMCTSLIYSNNTTKLESSYCTMLSAKNKRNSIKETEGVCLEKWTAKGSNKLWGLSEIVHCIAALAGFKNWISTEFEVLCMFWFVSNQKLSYKTRFVILYADVREGYLYPVIWAKNQIRETFDNFFLFIYWLQLKIIIIARFIKTCYVSNKAH